jgi:beta-galactosidase
LTTQYPDMMVVLRDGTRRTPGGRRDVDVDNEVYRHYVVEVCTRLGQRYGQHPAVIGWQIDNELIGPEGEPPECHTPAVTFRFRQYLKRVHGDLQTLNRRWGTRFWGQEYSDWGEISTPLNPRSTMGQVLDYSRYFSDSQKSFIELQYAALRKVISSRQWIGHNSTAIFGRGLDHAGWAQSLDVAGWDAYYGAAGRPHAEAYAAMAHDWMRAAKQKPFWVYETNSVDENFTPAFLGEMYARGAEAVVFWHWRSHRANAENDTNTICDYGGVPDPARLERLKSIIARPELESPQSPTLPPMKAALMFCPDCVRTSLTPDPYIQRRLGQAPSYLQGVIGAYRALRQLGVAVDVVGPDAPLDSYRLLVLPGAKVMSESTAARIRQFVAAGGTLLATGKTAQQDEWGAYRTRLGEPLEMVLGVVQHRPPRDEGDWLVSMLEDAGNAEAHRAEIIEPTSAEILSLGRAEGADLCRPAATLHQFGRGFALYLAVECQPLLEQLVRRACKLSGVACFRNPQPEVALLPHVEAGRCWAFNFGDVVAHIGPFKIEPRDFAVIPSLVLEENETPVVPSLSKQRSSDRLDLPAPSSA